MENSKLRPYALILRKDDPRTFISTLMDWATNKEHENSTLLLDFTTMRYIEFISFNYYYDGHSLFAVFDNCVIIGSRSFAIREHYVVLDELIETFPNHKVLYKNVGVDVSDELYITMLSAH